MNIPQENYLTQKQNWPQSGRHILACFDDETIWVYQAYLPAIGLFAALNGYFGDGFSYNRMSWIKPNFLWMMYRSNWGQSPGQEVVLAIRLRRTFFDSTLAQAVPSSYLPEQFESPEAWKSAVAQSEVRLQWDPDHLPNGDKQERRAIQLGLRGAMLESYGKEQIVEIVDLSEFVSAEREKVQAGRIEELVTPRERTYWPGEAIAAHIGITSLTS